MKLYFIRHLKTKGNYEKRYIGRMDEGLFAVDRQTYTANLPEAQIVFSSPMKRCLETAALMFQEEEAIIIEDLREIDFGDFEGKCYEELKDNPAYIEFIDSNGKGRIPNGENTLDFKKRCCEAFLKIIRHMEADNRTSAYIVCHGGTIMSILEEFDESPRSFYDYQMKNGTGFETEFNIETRKIKIIKEMV